MKIFEMKNLPAARIARLCERNLITDPEINRAVSAVIEEVRKSGDAALRKFSLLFDKVRLKNIAVKKDELKNLANRVPPDEKKAIIKAAENIRAFHKAQLSVEKKVSTAPGVVCWRESRPIEKVGLYVPGGTAVLPSTFLMLAIPALLAGCGEIAVCSPPSKNGILNPHVAYCADHLGIERVFPVGGAQAIAAMAFGTRTIPKTEKIFGPGNRYVTQAKNQVAFLGAAAIDFPAGPSEVLVVADSSANPRIVAADLLSAADHGTDSQVALVSPDKRFVNEVLRILDLEIRTIGRSEIIRQSLAKSFALVTGSLNEAIEFSNLYAPEHLILSCRNYRGLVPRIKNAGSVFLGYHSPESAGDYASGTNHTLPTAGFAKVYSGVSVDSFMKKISFQEISPKGLRELGKTIETLARIEGLPGHGMAVTTRLQKPRNP